MCSRLCGYCHIVRMRPRDSKFHCLLLYHVLSCSQETRNDVLGAATWRGMEGNFSLVVALLGTSSLIASHLLFLQIPVVAWKPELSSLNMSHPLFHAFTVSDPSPLKHDYGYDVTFILCEWLSASCWRAYETGDPICFAHYLLST